MIRDIKGTSVTGAEIDAETRCAHYHSECDIIAIKFRCCARWFSCYQCHAETADHSAVVWPRSHFDERAILCGGCGAQLTICEYLDGDSVCPRCTRQFNPNCARHRQLYFQTDADAARNP